jgi:hypothetical protein
MAFQSIRISIIAARWSLGAALLFPLLALGDEFVGPPAPPQLIEDVLSELDAPRDYVSEKFVGFVSSIDRFFGDDRHYQEANDSVFQLDFTRVMGYGGDHKFVLSGRAKVHLPVAEQKLHFIIESDPDKNASVDPKQAQSPPFRQPTAPQSYGAALRFMKAEAERWNVSVDGGLQFHGLSATPFARTRASMGMSLDQWRAKLSESVFWFNTIGVGETTQLDFERPVNETTLFRATSIAAWLNNTQNFDLRQDFIFFRKLDERTAMQYQASVIGKSKPVTQVTDYVLLVLYRYRLHREWVYFEVSPQLHFPKERNYQSNPALSLRLEMLFDEMK